MPEFRLPEATLIDIKRISKDYQNKWQAKRNYSRLFDLKEEYRCPKKVSSIFGINIAHYTYHLTKNMEIRNNDVKYICVGLYSNSLYDEDYEKTNSNSAFNIRPVFKYSDIEDYCDIVEELAPGYLIVTFGSYPQREIADIRSFNRIQIHCSDEGYTLMVDEEEVLYKVVSIEGKEGKYVERDDYLYLIEPVRFLVDVKKILLFLKILCLLCHHLKMQEK